MPPKIPTASQSPSKSTALQRDGGWGLVLIDLVEPLRTVPLHDGAILGSASRAARVEGPGVAPNHARIQVRSDGCYLEDLDAPEGTFVSGVRAKRINVVHGDVLRLGRQLAVFVERDLGAYAGPVEQGIVHGQKQIRDWIGPALALARGGACLCIEGGPGVGKRTLAELAASLRVASGEIMRIDGNTFAAGTPFSIAPTVKPATWLLLSVDRIPRRVQLEIAHAAERGGAPILATVNQPLDRAVSDGDIPPWFAPLFTGKRITVPSLDARREDILPIVRSLCERRAIPLERLGAEFLEAIVRSGWPGGVPQLESALVSACEAAPEAAPLSPAAIASSLHRPVSLQRSLPSTDEALARARLENALAQASGSIAGTARVLGLSRQGVYREATRLGVDIARRSGERLRPHLPPIRSAS